MIQLSHISFSYGDKQIFDDLSMGLYSGRINCFLGPSGCGKTSLLNILAGIIKPDQGQIGGLNYQVPSYIFQETRIIPWKNVFQNVVLPLKDKMDSEKQMENAEQYIRLVNLWDNRLAYPRELSGGMKQRVSIARAFAYPSSLVLMDEAFQGLDLVLKEALLDAFAMSWNYDPRTVVFVTHDLDEALTLGQEIFILPQAPIRQVNKIKIEQPPGKRENLSFYKEQIIKMIH